MSTFHANVVPETTVLSQLTTYVLQRHGGTYGQLLVERHHNEKVRQQKMDFSFF